MSGLAIKYTPLGLMIAIVMAAYLAAALAHLLDRRRAGEALFALGFAVAVAAWSLRWVEVSHPPLQNLFEVFLTLGAAVYPLSLLCRRYLGSSLPGVDATIGAVVLFPAAFVFSAEPQPLPPALQSWLFVPHVTAYMLAYIILFMAAAQATAHLVVARPHYEAAAWRMVRLAFPLLTLGLVLGAVWGKLAWGDYWNWDPKELWSLASWLVFVFYLHFRVAAGLRWPRANSALVVLGALAVIVTLLWVNLAPKFAGLHSYAS